MTGEALLKKTLEELDKLVSANTILGEPIEADDKTIIPVAQFGFGFGVGEGENEKAGGGAGSGAGGGVKPVALVILHKNIEGPEGVQVLSLQKKNEIAEIISTLGEAVIPQVTEAIRSRTKSKAAPIAEEKPEPEEP